MSVGGVLSCPRPRRERGVDSPGVRAVGERPWWRQTPNCMYVVQQYCDYTTCTVRKAHARRGMCGGLEIRAKLHAVYTIDGPERATSAKSKIQTLVTCRPSNHALV